MSVSGMFAENRDAMMTPLQPAPAPIVAMNNNGPSAAPPSVDPNLSDNAISVGLTLRHPDPNQKIKVEPPHSVVGEAGGQAMKLGGELMSGIGSLFGGSKADNDGVASAGPQIQPPAMQNKAQVFGL